MHSLRRAILVTTLGIACAVLPQAGLSQSEEPSASQMILAVQEVPGTADLLAAIDAQLRRGEWVAARDASLSLIETVRASLDPSELAAAVARLALAEAGMGQREDALWHWHVAQNLDQLVLSREALASFGPPGELLARHPLRQPGAAPAGLTVLDSEDPQVRPGRRIQGAIPRLSPEVAELPAPLALRFQIVVSAEGRPSDPLVLDPGPPGMVWEILEGVRGWRYLPAQRKKKPVAVTRTVSVNTPASLEPPPGEVPFEAYRADLEALIRAGQWQEAQGRAQHLWNEIIKTQQPRPADVAATLTLRALTQAGLGMNDEAVCRWQAAHLLDPYLKDLDLSFYGAAGELLAKNLPADEAPPGPARIEKRHKLGIPPASRLFPLKGTVTLAATVGPDGGVRRPRLLKTEANGHAVLEGLRNVDDSTNLHVVFLSRSLALNALDTVCDWRVRSQGPFAVQTVLELPFEIHAPRFIPAGGSGWPPAGSTLPHPTLAPRHYPQPERPEPSRPMPRPPG